MTKPTSAVRSAGDQLRHVQAIADAALSRLDPEQFLAELLDRAKDILRGDTAAVLLLDEASGQLIATAARGLEEEVARMCGSLSAAALPGAWPPKSGPSSWIMLITPTC